MRALEDRIAEILSVNVLLIFFLNFHEVYRFLDIKKSTIHSEGIFDPKSEM
jgi:hypothetical protein